MLEMLIQQEENREVMRCPFCRLNQYILESKLCRRCGKRIVLENPVVTTEMTVTSFDLSRAGANICLLRGLAKLTQEQLSKKINVARSHIARYETNAQLHLLPLTILRFERAFNLPPLTLCADSITVELLYCMSRLDFTGQHRVIQQTRKFLNL